MTLAWTQELKPDDTTAFLFPGTGSGGTPALNVLVDGAGDRAVARAVLDGAQEGLPPGWPVLAALLLDDPPSYARAALRPGVAQVCAYACSLVADRVLRARGVVPACVVGQSFGEIAAMVAAGMFTVADGARMAVSLVEVLSARGAGGGMAVVAAPEADTAALLAAAGLAATVVACTNAPAVTVVSGPLEELGRLRAAGRERGVRSAVLDVPYLAHHPSLAGADDQWYDRIRGFRVSPASLPVYSPVRGRAYHCGDDPHRALADCIVRPLRLPELLRAVHGTGVGVFVQAGPGEALCHSVHLSVPGARAFATVSEHP